jgi:hypothetical protein
MQAEGGLPSKEAARSKVSAELHFLKDKQKEKASRKMPLTH